MNTKLYVGNLNTLTTEDDLKTLFAEAGTVTSASIPTDARTGVNKHFGFVEMETAEGAQAAINEINGRIFQENALRVSEAREKR